MTDRFASVEQKPCVDLYRYCGGKYKAAIQKLDYIKNLGYNALWISPTVRQTEDSDKSYHGYWYGDFYESNPWFGTDQDLKDFIKECHKRDIWVMADIVYNHVGNCKNGLFDYSCVKTFPKAEHYHDYCEINNYNDQHEVQVCRLQGLPDLDQNNKFVRKTLLDWAVWYQKNYDFDGYRVDTVKHIDHEFYQDLRKVTPWFNVAEIFDGSFDFIKSYSNSRELYTAFNYPLFFNLRSSIGGGASMRGISKVFFEALEKFGDGVKDMGIFLENHDNARFLTEHKGDLKRYENALALVHTWVGIPYLYYGSEQDMTGGLDPDNRHALWELGYSVTKNHYPFIQKLNRLRAKFQVEQLDQRELYVLDNFYSYARGNKFMVALTNSGKNGETIHVKVPNTPFEPNTQVCNIFWENDCLNVNSDGSLDVTLTQGEAKVFVREKDTQ